MEDMFSDFLKKSNVIAVIGVSRDREKFGYKIYSTLKHNDYSVYLVNPKAEIIDDDRRYPSLSALPEKPDVVITVVQPAITRAVVKEMNELKIDKVWMQPGSESASAIDFCRRKGIKVVANACFVADGLKTSFL